MFGERGNKDNLRHSHKVMNVEPSFWYGVYRNYAKHHILTSLQTKNT